MPKILLFLCLIAFNSICFSKCNGDEILQSLKKTEVKNKIINYLSNLNTLQANFEQWSAKGRYYNGIIYLKKPHALFMQYIDEKNVRLLTDQHYLYFIDYYNSNVSILPIAQTPAYLLLNSDKIDLHFMVDSFKENKRFIDATFENINKNSNFGSLRLVLKNNPLQIIKWIIVDSLGNKTIVKLNNIKTNIYLSDNLFTLSHAKKTKVLS